MGDRDEVNWFHLDKMPDFHHPLIAFFKELGFEISMLHKLDIEFEGKGILTVKKDKNMKAFFVIQEDDVVMVLDTLLEKAELCKKMEEFFEFPKPKKE